MSVPYTTSAGSGPILLCLHGIGSSSRAFDAQLAGLADCARVVAWDAPGYGRTPPWTEPLGMDGYADAAVAVLDELGCDRADVLGTSFGGVVAVRLALRHPQRVRSLLLADTTPGSGVTPDGAEAMRGRPRERERLGAADYAEARVGRLLSPHANSVLRERVAATMLESMSDTGFAHAAAAMASTDHRGDFAGIAVPTIVIVGEHDSITPPEVARHIAASIPSATYCEIADAGHLSNVEQPVAFNAQVRTFLELIRSNLPTTERQHHEHRN